MVLATNQKNPQRNRSVSLSDLIEQGTPELRSKHKVVIDELDPKGLVRRARVSDQTELDKMFVSNSIDASQHAAGVEFLSALSKSGAFIAGASLEPTSHTPAHSIGSAIASKIMAMSAAFRRMKRDAGDESAELVMRLVGEDQKVPKDRWDLLREGLDALSSYYGTGKVRDPRKKSG